MYLLFGDCFTLGCRAIVLDELTMRRGILYGVKSHLGSLQSITNEHPWEEAHTLNLTNVCDSTLYTGRVCVCVHKYTHVHAMIT